MAKPLKRFPVTSIRNGVYSSDSGISIDLGGEKAGQFVYGGHIDGQGEGVYFSHEQPNRKKPQGSAILPNNIFEELRRPTKLTIRVMNGGTYISLKNAKPQCPVQAYAE